MSAFFNLPFPTWWGAFLSKTSVLYSAYPRLHHCLFKLLTANSTAMSFHIMNNWAFISPVIHWLPISLPNLSMSPKCSSFILYSKLTNLLHPSSLICQVIQNDLDEPAICYDWLPHVKNTLQIHFLEKVLIKFPPFPLNKQCGDLKWSRNPCHYFNFFQH